MEIVIIVVISGIVLLIIGLNMSEKNSLKKQLGRNSSFQTVDMDVRSVLRDIVTGWSRKVTRL
jgi:hypothetical protein